ncbi:hypothetical protein [Enterovirga sp.]|uniref:hypothetical protein n=1 Tax=Enterovirga sp. TaxID=2026350 RepID=UPI00260EF942|nr:hypothetical protein [Enterovirga sp.]
MRRKLAILGFATALLGGAIGATALLTDQTQAATAAATSFIIPLNDGYGVADCVGSGSSCGQVVADAWCEAQGFARSASFGPADVEVTGSIAPGSSRPISVTCAN